MNNSSRNAFLKIVKYLNGKIEIPVKLYPVMKTPRGDPAPHRTKFRILRENTDEFELDVGGNTIQLPYSMIKEVWKKQYQIEELSLIIDTQLEILSNNSLDISITTN